MYGNPYFSQQQRFQTVPNNNQYMNSNYMQQPIQPIQNVNTQVGLLGKIVESIEVVKATDIPLDGSVSYFPLTDGSAIITKQLQTDGTSRVTIYKPIQDDKKETIKFATIEDIQEAISELDLNDIQDLKEDVKEIKKQLKELKGKKVKDD